MPVCLAIHVHGRPSATPSEEFLPGDIIEAYEGRIRAGRVEAMMNDMWMASMGARGDKEFLLLFVPDMNLLEAGPFVGRRRGQVDWRQFFNAVQIATVLDRTVALPFQRPNLMVKAKVVQGPDHGLPRNPPP